MNCSTDDDRKQQALYYAGLGWPVFPVHGIRNGRCTCGKAECPDAGKHPRSKHGFKDATKEESKIRKWWSKWPEANIGIATGAVSGIVVIDVDPAHSGNDSLEAAKESLGPLPAGPVARTGGGGRHLVVAYPGRKIPSRRGLAPGIDIRGDGGYIVAPRSVHASGETYEWEIPPDKLSAPELPETWLEWMRPSRTHSKGCYTDSADHTDNSRLYRTAHDTHRAAEQVARRETIDEFIKEAIEASLPDGPGQRHDRLFEFARIVQGHFELALWPVNKLRPYVNRWYVRAVEASGTNGFNDNIDENWWDSRESWDKVRCPGDEGLMTQLLERATQASLPAVAMNYNSRKVRLLIALCRELQREAGEEPFFLSARTVAGLCDITPIQASRWLNGLARDEVLLPVSKGDYKTRRASEWRYIGGD